MYVLIWAQTVCKGYQETTKFSARNERVNEEIRNYPSFLVEILVLSRTTENLS